MTLEQMESIELKCVFFQDNSYCGSTGDLCSLCFEVHIFATVKKTQIRM